MIDGTGSVASAAARHHRAGRRVLLGGWLVVVTIPACWCSCSAAFPAGPARRIGICSSRSPRCPGPRHIRNAPSWWCRWRISRLTEERMSATLSLSDGDRGHPSTPTREPEADRKFPGRVDRLAPRHSRLRHPAPAPGATGPAVMSTLRKLERGCSAPAGGGADPEGGAARPAMAVMLHDQRGVLERAIRRGTQNVVICQAQVPARPPGMTGAGQPLTATWPAGGLVRPRPAKADESLFWQAAR